MPQTNIATEAKPFIKWAGGKGQLLNEIDARLPQALKDGAIDRYVEPFVGGGALFFHVVQNYPVRRAYLSDVNPEVVLLYRTVQREVEELIARLRDVEARYLPMATGERKAFYYDVRTQFNAALPSFDFDHYSEAWIERSAHFIFMNKTCFNGLFRVNSKGEFNVPIGRYKRPTICDETTLRAASALLQEAEIHRGDFEACTSGVDERSFVYFDPPYRPISATASFKSYAKGGFDDAEQLRLARFFRRLDERDALLMLSNSDPHNEDPEDDFFEQAYAGFRIERIQARRTINSKAGKRGEISELLILNYGQE